MQAPQLFGEVLPPKWLNARARRSHVCLNSFGERVFSLHEVKSYSCELAQGERREVGVVLGMTLGGAWKKNRAEFRLLPLVLVLLSLFLCHDTNISATRTSPPPQKKTEPSFSSPQSPFHFPRKCCSWPAALLNHPSARQLVFCIIDMYMNVLKGRELRRREEGVRRKLRDCAGEYAWVARKREGRGRGQRQRKPFCMRSSRKRHQEIVLFCVFLVSSIPCQQRAYREKG